MKKYSIYTIYKYRFCVYIYSNQEIFHSDIQEICAKIIND